MCNLQRVTGWCYEKPSSSAAVAPEAAEASLNQFLSLCVSGLFPSRLAESLSKWAADNLTVWTEMSSGVSRQPPSKGLTGAAKEMVSGVGVGERAEFMCSDYCLPLRRLTCTFHLMSVLKQ